MRALAPTSHPNLLVGPDSGDDAAVWLLSGGRALVATVDFITPIVDDARTWGRIAATNAISDVYAMGGTPLLALNIVAWNASELPPSLLSEVLTGAADVAEEERFVIAGGHTVDDPEPKFGLAVIGEADPENVLTNSGAQPGQVIVLSKALGTGVIATATKRGEVDEATLAEAVASMTRSNAEAATAALAAQASAATDITGFGLLGHLGQMALASGVDVELDSSAIPLLSGARELAEAGMVPEGTRRNLDWVEDRLDRGNADDITVTLLADAQTSGGLAFVAAGDSARRAVEQLRASGHACAVIGRTVAGTGRITLTSSPR